MAFSSFQHLRFHNKAAVKLVMQSEASECSLACLTMVASYHGLPISIDSLRQASPSSAQGSDLSSLMKDAEKLGLSSRALKADLHELGDLSLPAILHWNFNHFVVLCKVRKRDCDIADPARGLRRVNMKELGQSYTGIALELKTNTHFDKSAAKAEKKLRLRDFFKNTKNLYHHLSLLFGLSLLLQLFAIASPFYMQTVIDEVIVKSDSDLLVILALAFALLLSLDVITNFTRERVMLRFSNYLNLHMASSVFKHLLSLPIEYFQKRHLGDVVSRFGALQQIRNIISAGIVTALIDGLMAIVMLGVLVIYSAKLAAIVTLVLSLYIALRWAFFQPMKRQQAEVIQSSANENSHFMQSVRAIKTLKLNNNLAQRHSQWSNYLATAMNKQIRLSSWNINFNTLNKCLFGLENILIVFLAAHLVIDKLFSIGMLYAFMSYKSRFISASDSLINTWIEFKMLSVHLARLADILHSKSEISPSLSDEIQYTMATKASSFESIKSGAQQPLFALCAEQLSYRYHPSLPWIFENLNLHIPVGKTVAIVGESGSGKSTLFNCLMGLTPAKKGAIKITNDTGNQLTLSAQNRHQQGFAAVLQDDQLLTGSIMDNVSDFATEVNTSRVIEACTIACIHQDIIQMTMQYNSLVGDMGSSLSGGQKQRILLARALYKQPKILFLDEATSHLDVKNEKQINHRLNQLKITKIIIAHRPETIANADIVLSLHKGGLYELSPSNASATN